MKKTVTALSMAMLAVLTGCNQGTSGGPGAESPPATKSIVGQAEDTFSLSVPSTDINQGESKTVAIKISRGTNFSAGVTLSLVDLPPGVTLDPASPAIKPGDSESTFNLKAAADAAIGDFTISVVGHPSKGADAVSEAKLSVVKQVSDQAVANAETAAEKKWDEYTLAMETQLDQYKVEYAALQDRAKGATGKPKTELDNQVTEAKVKLDAAGAKLDEVKTAGADRWDANKEKMTDAFDDLEESLQ